MAKELVRYRDGKPALEDRLTKDYLPIHCSKCDAEYRMHYSLAEINRPHGLENLRAKAQEVVNATHSGHLATHNL